MTTATTLRRPLPLFSFAAAAIAIACVAITRSHAFAANPDVLAWSVTFDLTITIPLLYWLFVIRTGAARAITIVPVFVIGATIAALAIPRGQQQFLHELRFLVAPLEVVTILLIVRKIRSGAKPDNLVFGVVATEVSVLRYSVAGWHRRIEVPADAKSFTIHERTGWGAIVAALMLVIVAESLAAHLLIQMWSVRAAWIMTALDLYAILWLLGDYNALRLRPSYASDGVLHVRYGLRWNVTVVLDDIASIEPVREEGEWKRRGVLKVAMLDAPRFLVRLRTPVVAHGLAGIRKTVDAIAIAPDDDAAFASAVRP